MAGDERPRRLRVRHRCAGANTRRYHGLLVAALRPPVDRTLMVAKLDAVATYRGRRFELATNEYADGTIAPRGYELLERSASTARCRCGRAQLGDAVLEQRIWMAHGANTTYVQFHVVRARRAGASSSSRRSARIGTITRTRTAAASLRRSSRRSAAAFVSTPSTARSRIDCARTAATCVACAGLVLELPSSRRSRARPRRRRRPVPARRLPMTTRAGETVTLTLTASDAEPLPRRAQRSNKSAHARQRCCTLRPTTRRVGAQLDLAADQFIVAARRDGNGDGTTVIAGYPWFSDWGRDTMIALPGLTLPPAARQIAANDPANVRRASSAKACCRTASPTAAKRPSTTPSTRRSGTSTPSTRTSRASDDRQLLRRAVPGAARRSSTGIERGTRYGIQRRSSSDGLLYAGETGVQLTWMDAKVGDWVVTPRIGKPVEINALWFNALSSMRDLRAAAGRRRRGARVRRRVGARRAQLR